jgi:hypothetical protein
MIMGWVHWKLGVWGTPAWWVEGPPASHLAAQDWLLLPRVISSPALLSLAREIESILHGNAWPWTIHTAFMLEYAEWKTAANLDILYVAFTDSAPMRDTALALRAIRPASPYLHFGPVESDEEEDDGSAAHWLAIGGDLNGHDSD